MSDSTTGDKTYVYIYYSESHDTVAWLDAIDCS